MTETELQHYEKIIAESEKEIEELKRAIIKLSDNPIATESLLIGFLALVEENILYSVKAGKLETTLKELN